MNASVLVHHLAEVDREAELVFCHPSQSRDYLSEGRVDAAILPIVDFFDCQGLQIVDHLGICAQGEVKSVLLHCRRPLDEIQTVRLDPASKTSNTLVRILLEQHFHIAGQIQYESDIGCPDAEVVIGDRALTTQFEGVCYDLAQEWDQITGFGFVFAVWACRNDHPDRDRITSVLRQSKEIGQANVSNLSKIYAEKLQLPQDFCEQYLTKWIRYEIVPPVIEGMELFRKLYYQLLAGP